jgi:pimeloyl-ACP methyl ester carboxylesterase
MRLHVQTLGGGEPLVLLHGLPGSGDNWLPTEAPADFLARVRAFLG